MQGPGVSEFSWRCVERRPLLGLEISRVPIGSWQHFKRHHYLSQEISPSAQCWACLCEGDPAAFVAMLHMPQPKRSFWRVSRLVCLPDFQGVGVAGTLLEFVCGLYRCLGKPVSITSGHPGLVRALSKSHTWKTLRPFSARLGRRTGNRIAYSDASSQRKTASFEYVGPAEKQEARAFGLCR